MEIKEKTIKISACLVARNEESCIENCLRSLVNVVDEIILVHDGDCDDNTLKIAQQYQVNIFIRPYVGMMEAHLVFALKQSHGDWVLRIDADEFLSDDLKANMKKLASLAERQGVSAYSFPWLDFNMNNREAIKSKERKTAFFKRQDLYWFSMPHFAWQTRGAAKRVNYILGQVMRKRSFGEWLQAQKKWAKIQAEYILKDYDDLENFQAQRSDWEKVYAFSRRQARNPLLAPIKMLKSLGEELMYKRVGFRKAIKRALYNFYLGYYINYLSRR